MVSKTAVIGIDLGASESFVAFVGKGLVDIVQNEVSKRNTSTLVGFTTRERLLGDSALAQIKSNAKNTCRNFKHLLGQKLDQPMIEKEKFWSTCDLATSADGCAGYDITYKGAGQVFSATQIMAMFLTKLRDTTEKWCQAKVTDVVIGVPSYYSDVHRQAVLDAARIANLSVLRLMNEHTATALAYGIYRTNDFDVEKPYTVAFCSMGHSIFSVAVVRFVRGKLTVLCEASDKVGGRDMDECLMRVFAAQFKDKTGNDPLANKKASFKLEDAVTKTKKILSANNEATITCECLMEDEDFASSIKRPEFEEMCKPMMARVQAVLDKAKSCMRIPVPVDELDSVEVVGGASRVPWVKRMCSEAFGGKELSTTMNADESVARGCALQAAIQSPLYKVRDFTVEDYSPYGVDLCWDSPYGGENAGQVVSMDVFPPGSGVNTWKVLTYYRTAAFELKARYSNGAHLVPGTVLELGTHKVLLDASSEEKKVKVRVALSLHGTFVIESAEIVEDESFEETVKEKRQIPAAAEAEAAPAEEEQPAEAQQATEEGDVNADPAAKEGTKTEKAAAKKDEASSKWEWVEVKKTRIRTKRTPLTFTSTGVLRIPESDMQSLIALEAGMQAEMSDIVAIDDKRNDLEGYILNMRDKIATSGEYGAFLSDADRDKFNAELQTAEDWLYSEDNNTIAQYDEKMQHLKQFGDPVARRKRESDRRPELIKALQEAIVGQKGAAPAAVAAAELWLAEMTAKQDGVPAHEMPVLLCGDLEMKLKEVGNAST